MRARAVTAIAAAALIGGCGSSDSDKAASPASTPGGATAPTGSAPKTAKAGMKDFEFVPASVTVAAGGKVTWTDHDSSNHNVKVDGSGAPEGISNLNQNESGSIRFKTPGTYQYVCTYHPNMHGTVVVR
jgi:plastocyanin